MNILYEISTDLMSKIYIDEETGEIDDELLNSLEMAFDEKLENLMKYVKNLLSEAISIKEEEKRLKDRREAKENKASRLKDYIKSILILANKKKIEYASGVVKVTSSTAVEVDDSFIEWAKSNADDLLTYKEPTANKTAIKEAITNGIEVSGARIIENKNLSIK